MVTVTFACGHSQRESGSRTPECVRCGETRVERVAAPKPTITVFDGSGAVVSRT